jgi:hypothetical protein
MICPIDREPCEAANGIINSSECRGRCSKGLQFATSILGKKNLGLLDPNKSHERHGVYGWAKYHKCKCDLCKDALNKYKRERNRDKGVPEFKPTQHGSRRMYEFYKCRCELCLNYNLRRNAIERERYRKQKEKMNVQNVRA